MQAWLNVIGIAVGFVGAWILASILILKEDEALELGMARWGHDEREDNLRLPMVRLFLAQSRRTIMGMCVVSLGTILQIAGNWP